jgi:hypothetical protein
VAAEDPEYLPEEVLAWADEHRDVLELIAGELRREGTWPTSATLTRRLARENRPIPLTSLLSGMPKPLGFVENYPGRIVLLLHGLRLTSAGRSLVEGFFAVLQIAKERYQGDEDPPLLTRDQLARVPAPDDAWSRALSEIVVREAPFLGTGSGTADEAWSFEITDLVVHYWDAESADDYLRIRANELRMSPQFGFGPPREPVTERPSAPLPADDVRDVFVSHASEDKDAIARPLADELLARDHTVWFDEYELVLGDSLTERIDEGLARSTIGVVILSHDIFAKPWPKRELAGLTARLTGGEQNVLVPIWHGLTKDDILKYSPPLADRLAGNSAEGVEKLAGEIERALARRKGEARSGRPLQVPGSSPGPPADSPVETSADAAPWTSAEIGEPGGIHDETLDLVRRGENVGLDELLRRERHTFESAIEAVTAAHVNHHTDETSVRDVGTRLVAAADRRLSSLIPLALYRAELLETELRAHAGWATSTPLQGGSMTWQQAWRIPFWMIGMTLGALATRLERHAAIRCILATSWTNREIPEPFVGGHLGEAAEDVAAMFGPAPPVGQRWGSSPWAWLVADLATKQWLADRCPDWLSRAGEPQASLTEFDLIACIARGLQEEGRQIGLWTINADAAERFARRVHSDQYLRRQVAEAVGTTLETFDQRAPEVLRSVHSIGMFSRHREVAMILQTGSAR